MEDMDGWRERIEGGRGMTLTVYKRMDWWVEETVCGEGSERRGEEGALREPGVKARVKGGGARWGRQKTSREGIWQVETVGWSGEGGPWDRRVVVTGIKRGVVKYGLGHVRSEVKWY